MADLDEANAEQELPHAESVGRESRSKTVVPRRSGVVKAAEFTGKGDSIACRWWVAGLGGM